MRTKQIILFAIIGTFVFLFGCKKDAGPGGKNSISGTILFKNGVSGGNDAAPAASVSIAYGTKEPKTEYNKTILAGNDGTYKFEGLNKGDYFITASYKDEHGFTYTTAGVAITINTKKKNTEANITLE